MFPYRAGSLSVQILSHETQTFRVVDEGRRPQSSRPETDKATTTDEIKSRSILKESSSSKSTPDRPAHSLERTPIFDVRPQKGKSLMSCTQA